MRLPARSGKSRACKSHISVARRGHDAFHWRPALTVVAAALLAIESLVFVWVHAKYGEITPIIVSGVLGLLMAFVAYGRMVLTPIS